MMGLEFNAKIRDGKSSDLLGKIFSLAEDMPSKVKLMEVCGTHTQAIARYGIKSVLPENIKLVSGPGCPVCVTPQKAIDEAVALALAGIPVATYGDMLRVPGTGKSLEGARQGGAKVFIVESTVDALRLKKEYPGLVFLGIGFETTTPMTAWAVRRGLDILCCHKTIPEAMQAIVSDPENRIDGFINPGHVSSIIGPEAYAGINAPQVITGFEPEDVLQSILMLLHQIKRKEKKVENQYARVVKPGGNPKARQLIESVFEKCESEWRGIGNIPQSGLMLRYEYLKNDAGKKHADILKDVPKPKKATACRCADVITGKIEPIQCALFSKECTEEAPKGPCMVGSEGACRISYKYGDMVK